MRGPLAQPAAKVPVVAETYEDTAMDYSIYQARWLLGPVFGIAFAVIFLGAFAS